MPAAQLVILAHPLLSAAWFDNVRHAFRHESGAVALLAHALEADKAGSWLGAQSRSPGKLAALGKRVRSCGEPHSSGHHGA
jgi:hypothetical protein